MRRTLSLLTACLSLAACASSEVKTATRTTRQGIGGAVTQPLADFNLIQTKIPSVLKRAQKGPYVHEDPVTCEYIRTEVAALDDALGPDLDVLDPATSDRRDQGAAMLGRYTVSGVRNLATDWIPLRSWVRMLTGAEAHSGQVRKAVNAGLARRAYLKGIGQAQGCPVMASAAPTQFPAPPITPSSADDPSGIRP